ncbi:hypothetical protein IAT38_000271 [Cryptococcus sp. DSM 104549]
MIPGWTRRIYNPRQPRWKLTLMGRAIALISGELLANAAVWVAAGICFRQADGVLGLAVLAWTIGLRHGLDADHISAIDNATRQLVSLGQLPITCGLFFSLGHSTIVIVVNIAIAVSVDIYDKLDKVGSVGGIIGASVSASFLFFIACVNIYFLIGAIKQRRRVKARQALGLPPDETEDPTKIYGGGCMVRVIAPILRAVDKPWKMYPVGILFGFGFDTASSIALLAISAIAQRGPHGESINHGKIVVLPFLFTAGMSLVDSLDSILMLYAYATPSRSTPEGKIALLQDPEDYKDEYEAETVVVTLPARSTEDVRTPSAEIGPQDEGEIAQLEREQSAKARDLPTTVGEEEQFAGGSGSVRAGEPVANRRVVNAKANAMSNLSIILTLLSILVALSISLITIMGLIGENCTQCTEAAADPDGGGLAGSWWRAWARANDQSGYIGAAIVGCFAAILFGYYGGRWAVKKWSAKRAARRSVTLGQDVEHE